MTVGISGGIGSGKSFVSRIFTEAFGIPVYVADERARFLSEHDPALRAELTEIFGPEAYGPDGSYNRRFVAGQVFQHPERLARLNAAVHPRVHQDAAAWALAHAAAHPYVLYEAALLEAADGRRIQKLIVVEAPEGLRINRIKARDPHRSETEIRGIMARQLPAADRRRHADFLIVNDETTPLLPQVLAVHDQLKNA